jgi:membrane fusion protein, multidrug efflux system
VKRSLIAAAAVVVAALAGGASWYAGTKPQQPAPVPVAEAVPVVAATIANKNVPIYLLGVGTVIAYNTDTVRSQIQGQLTQITFTEGQTVKAGDLLA